MSPKTSELVKMFLSRNNFADLTVKSYSQHLNRFMKLAPDDITAVTTEHLQQYIDFFKKGKSPNTVNLHICCFKSLFLWLHQNRYCENIAEFIRTEDVLQTPQRVLSRFEYDRVCERVQGYQKDVFIFLCNSGLRAQEFINLTKQNMSGDFIRIIGKGRTNRSIPVNSAIKTVLDKYEGFEFIRGTQRSWLRFVCDSISKKARIAKFHPHSCRHYFATELYHRGVPIATISRLLGHKSTAVTEKVYIDWSEAILLGSTEVLA